MSTPLTRRSDASASAASDALARVGLALRRITVPFPYLAGLAAAARVQLDARVPTMGVFASGRMVANAQFVGKLNDADLNFVVAHELLHLALRTHQRARGSDLMQFNVAHDYIINDVLRHELGISRIPAGGLDMQGARLRSAEAILLELRREAGAQTAGGGTKVRVWQPGSGSRSGSGGGQPDDDGPSEGEAPGNEVGDEMGDVLADALDIPNFYQKSQQYWYYLMDRYLLGSHAARTPVDTPSEQKWLLMYTPISLAYRLMVSYAIVIFVMDLWFALGLVMLAMTLYLLAVAPAWKGLNHLLGPQVQAHRWRAWTGAGALISAVSVLVFAVPWPHSIQAQGVVQMSRFSVLYAPLDGRLERAVLGHGQTVAAGTPLMWFDPTVISLEIEQTERERDELVAQERAALARQAADWQPLVEQRLAKQQRLAELNRRRQLAVVRAPHAGRFVALEGGERQGSWLAQGTEMGHVLDPSQGYQFVAVVTQERARELFSSPASELSLRLLGQADQSIAVERWVLLPYQRDRLPSAALGWLGGGDLAVSTQDAKGEKAAEEFFEVRMTIKADPDAPVVLAHGMRGVLRLALPARSLYDRVNESLRQLVQKRYRLG
jgi:biotin carboxyl carrier protein